MLFEEVAQDTGAKRLINLSPYGEWRGSPMGLAGRDPIFLAQLQGEVNHFPQIAPCMENTCLHCHGVMGQRQLAIDTPGQDVNGCSKNFGVPPPPEVPFGRPVRRAMMAQWPQSPTNQVLNEHNGKRELVRAAQNATLVPLTLPGRRPGKALWPRSRPRRGWNPRSGPTSRSAMPRRGCGTSPSPSSGR
jgi:hypothetical protein